ncbi:MAG: DUF1924 domain-containing protein, partial [Hydrogenophaga sp.]|nr:DUF1924 domain-containing protein [Hydrogenophaga sp.]
MNHALSFSARLATVAVLTFAAAAQASDTTPGEQLSRWSAQAGAPGSASKGQAFFNQRHGGEWSCASCHGTPPIRRKSLNSRSWFASASRSPSIRPISVSSVSA